MRRLPALPALLLALLLALPVALLPAAPRAETSIFDVRSQLVQFLLRQISTPGSFEVTVEGVEAPGEGVTRLLGLRVRDAEGVWIEAGAVSLAWNATRLLRGELEIPLIRVEDLSVLRLPAPGSEAPKLREEAPGPAAPSPFDWPRAPLALRIAEMTLANVAVAEGVLGPAIRFDATGAATDEGDVQEVRIAVDRRDAVAGRIRLDYRRDFAAETLRLLLEADEAAGGLVAALLGLPEGSRSRLRLEADGPRAAWALGFLAEAEQVFVAQGRAQVSFLAPLSADARFALLPGPAMGPETRALLGEAADLTVRLSEDAGIVTLDRFDIDSPELRLRARGTYARADGRLDLAADLAAGAGLAVLAPGLAFEGFRFAGRISGTPGAHAAEGAAELRGLRSAAADAGRLALDLALREEAGGWGFRLAGTGEAVRLDRLLPDLLGPVTLEAAGRIAGGRLVLDRADLAARPLRLEGRGTADLAFASGRFDLRADLPDLDPLAAAYGLAASGAARLGLAVTLAGGRATLAADGTLRDVASAAAEIGLFRLTALAEERRDGLALLLEGRAEGLRLDRLGPELLGPARLGFAGLLAGERLRIDRAVLESRPLVLALSGEAAADGSRIALDYRAEAPDLAPLAAAYGVDLAGALRAEGRAEGPVAALRLAGRLALAGAAAEGRPLGSLALAHDVTLAPLPAGRLDLDWPESPAGPFRLAAGFRLAAPALALEEIRAEASGLRLTGGLVLDTETGLAEGRLALAPGEVGPLARRLGLPVSGRLGGEVTLTAREGRQDLAAELAGEALASGGIRLAGLRARLALRDALGTPALDLGASGTGLRAGEAEIARLTASARGPLARLAVAAEAEGRLGTRPLALALAGSAAVRDGEVRATLGTLRATLGDLAVTQEGPLAVRAGARIALSGLDLRLAGGGRLAGALAFGGGRATGRLEITGLALAPLAPLLGLPVNSGRLDATVALGPASGSLEARIAGLGHGLLAGESGRLDAALRGAWDGRVLRAEATVEGGFGEPVRASLALPLRPGAPLPVPVPGGALEGRLDWAGEIGPLWALVPLPDHDLTGRATIALGVNGTLAAPRLSGTLALAGGRYQNLEAGVILTEIEIGSTMDEAGALALRLAARDGAEGRVEAEARIAQALGAPEIDLAIRARQAILVRRDDVTARLDADITVKGPADRLLVAGTIGIDRAEVRLVDATPPAILELEGLRFLGEPPPPGSAGSGGRIRLDLRITAPGGIFVRGRGLDSEWRASLAVGGTAARPRLRGTIERLRGRFDLIGKAFDLVEGRLTFAGGTTINPELNVVLERRANEITGRITVTGPARDPEIGFSSVPALPGDEVLPRLLFGTAKQALTPAQALQLAVGLRTLASGSAGPLDTARGLLGIDVLQVDPGEDGSATVTVGKTVAPGVFVGAKRDLTDAAGGAVTVEIEVFPNLRVQGEAGVTSSRIGIEWSRDF